MGQNVTVLSVDDDPITTRALVSQLILFLTTGNQLSAILLTERLLTQSCEDVIV